MAPSSASAVPISSYEGTLSPDVTVFGQLMGTGAGAGSPGADFWSFAGIAGNTVTLTVNRLESELDPYMQLYFGTGTDTDFLTQLASADDNYPELPGFAGPFADPQISFLLASTGLYTVHVSAFGGHDPGQDGLFDYQLTMGTPPTGEVLPHNGGGTVPEPASLALFSAALLGLGALRRRRED